MKTCIATGSYHKPGETFVNRHIARLFGGATCVLAHKLNGENPYDKAVATRRAGDTGPGDVLARPVARLGNQLRYRTSAVPVGRTRRDLAGFLRREGVEALLAEFGSEAVAVAPVARTLGLPVFAYFRGYDASKDLYYARRRTAYRRLMPQLAGVFAVSRFLLDNLAAHGIAHPHAAVLPSGVDLDRFAPGGKRAGRFLAVGRFIPKKAPEVTVRAFCVAARDHPEAVLEMIGDGPLLDDCRRIAAAAGMTDRVIFHGAQPHEMVRDRLAGASVFLQHSVTGERGNTEGLPTSIQEAMAAGAVVIATRHAGIPEAVTEGATGWLVAEHDETAFAERITRALTRPEALDRMAGRARSIAAARFDAARLLAELEARMCERAGAVRS